MHKNVKVWLYAIIVILLLAIGALAYFDLFKKDIDSSDEPRDTSSQPQLRDTISPDNSSLQPSQPSDTERTEGTDTADQSQNGPRRTKEGIGGQEGYQ